MQTECRPHIGKLCAKLYTLSGRTDKLCAQLYTMSGRKGKLCAQLYTLSGRIGKLCARLYTLALSDRFPADASPICTVPVALRKYCPVKGGG